MKTRLCRADECPRNGMKAFETAEGLKVLVVDTGDRYVGYQAFCPHMDVALEEGFYDGAVITCHQHLWQWEAPTGAPLGDAETPLDRYQLTEEDGVLYLVTGTAP